MSEFKGIQRNSDEIPEAIFVVEGIKCMITEAALYGVIDSLKKYGFETKAQDEALVALLAFTD